MSGTRKNTAAPKPKGGTKTAPKLTPVSPAEALEMLRSAIVYCQISGVAARYKMTEQGLHLLLDGVQLQEKRFVLAPPEADKAMVAIIATNVGGGGNAP